ncbi:MAG TPA: RecQ family ATP-dependent DNA helicase [Nocardioidaceae bacterium]|nr:RecQ family ATP-dependent DNA helicase [Nocardioidaceae bacterium]
MVGHAAGGVWRLNGPPSAADSFDAQALAALQKGYGADVQFRDQQREAVRSVALDRGRVLLVQRTGWGKSAVYFVSTRLLRDAGAGPTIIISPLLALMRDQMEAADRLGLSADTINSSNKAEWDRIEAELIDGSVDLLLISPERLNNADFRSRLLRPLARSTGLLVIDEAHCISDWGHDFRPDYRRLVRVLELMPPDTPVLCTTATANDRVVSDISAQLGDSLAVIRGKLGRDTLWLGVRAMPSQAARLVWLLDAVGRWPGSGIVYCLTVADTHRIADWFRQHGVAAAAYSGETEDEDRRRIEQQLKANELKVVVATSALGMGFDKPDLTFVVHYQSPDSPIAYYQQIGRAGRSVTRADVVLLTGYEDEDIWKYFLETSLPLQGNAEAVVDALTGQDDWVSQRNLESMLNLRSARLSGLLKILEVEGAVERSGTRYRRTDQPWAFDEERYERVRASRLAEQEAMRAYADSRECRMSYLQRLLDDRDISACGRCDNCRGEASDWEPAEADLAEAVDFIRRRPVEIEPRKQWATGGRIAAEQRSEPGLALAYLSDPGWGRAVLSAKRDGSALDDGLVDAAAALVRRWSPSPAPAAVVSVPSWEPTRRAVLDFAERLADALGLPLLDVVRKTRPAPPQTSMENSWQQWHNVDGAYEVVGTLPSGPLLLVDDIVDSRWTLTTIGAQLRSAGSGPVFPFALAKVK